MNIEIFTIPSFKTHKEQSEFCKNKLIEICKNHYSYQVDASKIEKNKYGKPCFTDNSLHFNISHSKAMGAIVVDDKSCGIDIEFIRDAKMSVANRFFTKEETDWIFRSKDEEQQKNRFFRIWTGKESYTKMLGCGLTKPMNTFSVLDEEIASKLRYIIVDDYLICVCSQQNIDNKEKNIIPVSGR